MSTDDRVMSQMMKEGCADLHEKAEHARFPQRMVAGELTKEEFAASLSQCVVWEKALDEAILAHRDSNQYLKALVNGAQLQGPYYDEDMAHYGVTTDTDLAPGVKAMCEVIQNAKDNSPLTLLGLHYVREGANNGNHYVAKKLRQAWGITDDAGLRTLDPYGDNQRASWEAFKTTLDAQPFTAEEKDQLVQAGRIMFERVMAIHEDLASAIA